MLSSGGELELAIILDELEQVELGSGGYETQYFRLIELSGTLLLI